MSADDKQVGGNHYKKRGIQPWDVMKTIQLSDADPFHEYLRFTALKHIMRVGTKGDPLEDVEKAIHFLEKLREEMQ